MGPPSPFLRRHTSSATIVPLESPLSLTPESHPAANPNPSPNRDRKEVAPSFWGMLKTHVREGPVPRCALEVDARALFTPDPDLTACKARWGI